jgi:hypothetical protein
VVANVDFIVENFGQYNDLFVPASLLFEKAAECKGFVRTFLLVDEWKSQRGCITNRSG